MIKMEPKFENLTEFYKWWPIAGSDNFQLSVMLDLICWVDDEFRTWFKDCHFQFKKKYKYFNERQVKNKIITAYESFALYFLATITFWICVVYFDQHSDKFFFFSHQKRHTFGQSIFLVVESRLLKAGSTQKLINSLGGYQKAMQL